MHKKRPRDPISTIATLLWMTAGSAKIRDRAVGMYSRPFSVAANWIDRDLANRQFFFSLGDKRQYTFPASKAPEARFGLNSTMTTVESGQHLLVTGGAPPWTECCERFPVPEQSKTCSDFRGIDFYCPGL